MRFAVWPIPHQPLSEILELGQHCAATGWDGVWVADHLMNYTGDETAGDQPTNEAWTTLAALAVSVPRIRLGTLASANTFRHPALLAKMAATVDQLSGGRAVLGIGAGWQENEHVAYGFPLPEVKERLDRLDEACQVLTSLLRESHTTLEGRHYRIAAAPLEPKPIQRPLPLLVAGGGEARTMRIAATYADEWNCWATPTEMMRKRSVLQRHCEAVGRRTTIDVSTQARVYDTDSEGHGRYAIGGTVTQLIDHVAAYQDAGVDEFIVPDWTTEPLSQRKRRLDRFIEQVAPDFR